MCFSLFFVDSLVWVFMGYFRFVFGLGSVCWSSQSYHSGYVLGYWEGICCWYFFFLDLGEGVMVGEFFLVPGRVGIGGVGECFWVNVCLFVWIKVCHCWGSYGWVIE